MNPTPEEQEIKWHKGVVITIPSDGHVDLSVEQMDDFRPGKPGSEEVQGLMDHKGVFLFDSDIDYDVQALEALKKCYKSHQNRYNDSVQSLRRERAAQGISESDDSFDEILRQLGLINLSVRIEVIKKRVNFYEKVVGEKQEQLTRTNQMDPERTLFLVSGLPREFPSRAAKQLFKEEHSDMIAGDPAEVEETK